MDFFYWLIGFILFWCLIGWGLSIGVLAIVAHISCACRFAYLVFKTDSVKWQYKEKRAWRARIVWNCLLREYGPNYSQAFGSNRFRTNSWGFPVLDSSS